MGTVTKDSGFTPVMIRSFLASILGMFYFGYNTGVIINVPEKSIVAFINESHRSYYGVYLEETWHLKVIFTFIVSPYIVGVMVGAMIGGMVAEKVGSRMGVMGSSIIGVWSVFWSAFSAPCLSWEVLLISRLEVGLTAGLNTVVCPMYVAELAPVKLRGGMGIGNLLAVTLGIFIGQVLGLPNVLGGSTTWPWLISLAAVPLLLQLVLLGFFPPYLYISEDFPEAQVDAEMKELLAEKEASKEPVMGVFKLLGSSYLVPALIICVVMHLSQQLWGMVQES